jgi:hypothetical protein
MRIDPYDPFAGLESKPEVAVGAASQSAPDAVSLDAKFARNTNLALDVGAEIMCIPLDPTRPNYASELRAKAAVASTQVGAQIRADEVVVKTQRSGDRIQQLLVRLKEVKERLAASGFDRPEHSVPRIADRRVSRPSSDRE